MHNHGLNHLRLERKKKRVNWSQPKYVVVEEALGLFGLYQEQELKCL